MPFAYAGTYGPELINDATGRPLSEIAVAVYAPTTTTPVQLYTDRTMTVEASNPTATDDRGNLTFYCEPGLVDLVGNSDRITVNVPADSLDITEKAGDTMLGPLILSEDPSVDLGAATKEYVDEHEGGGGGGGGSWTGDVTGTDGITTLNATSNVEQIMRQQSMDQIAAPQGSVSWNAQDLVDVATLAFADGGGFGDLASLTIEDGTASHGSILLADDSEGPSIHFLADTADTEPLIAFGSLFGDGGLFFGPGGSSTFDVSLLRTGTKTLAVSAGTVTLSDATTTDGSIIFSLDTPLVSFKANSGDAQPIVQIGDYAGASVVGFGAGGSSGLDVNIQRSGANALKVTASAGTTFTGPATIADGTAGHGSVLMALDPAVVQFFANATDTEPLIGVGSLAGTPFVAFGPGGSSAADAFIQRNGTNALKVLAGAGTEFSGPVVFDQTAAPSGLTSNTNMAMSVYAGSGGTNYYVLITWNDGGTVRYKYMLLNGTGTTWSEGTSLPT
jgi:hypothetical protein